MTNISVILDAVRTVMPTLTGFSSKTEIPNAYDVQSNSSQFIENGWGIKVGPTSPSSVQVFCLNTEARQISIVLSRAVYKNNVDTEQIHAASKALFEDAEIVKNRFLKPDQLTKDENIENITLIGDSGINFCYADKQKIVYTEINFSFDIAELN